MKIVIEFYRTRTQEQRANADFRAVVRTIAEIAEAEGA